MPDPSLGDSSEDRQEEEVVGHRGGEQQAVEPIQDPPVPGNGSRRVLDVGIPFQQRLDEITDLYVRASEMRPRDAMERLDIEAALAELE